MAKEKVEVQTREIIKNKSLREKKTNEAFRWNKLQLKSSNGMFVS